jgi:hypothetical protein
MRLWVIALLCLYSGCLAPVTSTTAPEPVTITQGQTETGPSKLDPKRVIPISYEDLDIPLDPDSVFDPKLLTQRVLDLDGKRVRITGFMHGGSIYSSRGIKQFILLREKECPFGEGGQAHHAIAVTLGDEGTRFVVAPLTVEGKLAVEPVPDVVTGNTLYLYTLTDAAISK